MQLTDRASDLTGKVDELKEDKRHLQEVYQRTKKALDDSSQKNEKKVADLLEQLSDKDESLSSTVEALNDTS